MPGRFRQAGVGLQTFHSLRRLVGGTTPKEATLSASCRLKPAGAAATATPPEPVLARCFPLESLHSPALVGFAAGLPNSLREASRV
mmetsp:Transcript_26712/g.69095  ORF Transcript_26712/g.69095 Transcript_26712/m.69095 type:complete len:86 (-) Transcript_26712:1215-1472(-)